MPSPTERPAVALLRLSRSLGLLLLMAAIAVPYLAGSAVPIAAAGTLNPDVALYLEQAQPAIADAQSDLDSLSYYLPLGSISDENDPTWALAQQASEALREDAGELQTLSPPDALTDTNAALIQTILSASTSSDAAIAALSSGDSVGGQAALSDFGRAAQAFARAQSGLPAAAATPGSP